MVSPQYHGKGYRTLSQGLSPYSLSPFRAEKQALYGEFSPSSRACVFE